jgi:hypothetical protein
MYLTVTLVEVVETEISSELLPTTMAPDARLGDGLGIGECDGAKVCQRSEGRL